MSDQDLAKPKKLEKSLKLFDVYSMATGAMFSSGLFLLPGIAASYTGNSVYLAYMFAGVLILPAMFCMAELSTAMPKAGGTYFFLDRALGPMMGTIGGLGSWVAVVFKSAFALVGMGAYLGLYLDVPILVTAVFLTLVFGAVNLFGAKETTLLQRILVTVLVVILSAFCLIGLINIGPERVLRPDPAYGGFFSSGLVGFISTIGLVFVSYAGLTKVASVAEEIENPERNIPLGMTLSLITATAIYTLGALILVTVMPPQELFDSLTPVADAGRYFLGWAPWDLGVILIVISAVAAFASTGNAGIMSASRYPFAMAKDKLLPEPFSRVGRFGTPSVAIVTTTLGMIAVLLIFDVASVAKLASAFQLLLFGLVAIAVIVMREARIDTYKPGFKVPLYPWTPIVGILIAFWLIIEMGILAIGFTGMLLIGCVLWYQFYAASVTQRRGAIFHVHERLGRQRYEGIEHELMTIVHDRTQAQNLSYETVVAQSAMRDLPFGQYDLPKLVEMMGELAAARFDMHEAIIAQQFADKPLSFQLLQEGMAIAYRSDARLKSPALFVFRFGRGTTLEVEGQEEAHTLMFLVTPPKPAGLDLRIIGHLAEVAQGEGFIVRWLSAADEKAMNEILMRDDHFIHAPVNELAYLSGEVGKAIADIALPASCLIVMIEREGRLIIAQPREELREDDLLAIIGEPGDLGQLYEDPGKPADEEE